MPRTVEEFSAARCLAYLLRSQLRPDQEELQLKIERFDAHEPRFSGRMTELYLAMGEGSFEYRQFKRKIDSDHDLPTTPEGWKLHSERVISTLVRNHTMSLFDEVKNPRWNSSKARYIMLRADEFIKEKAPSIRPDSYSADLPTLTSYCRNLGLAALVIASETLHEGFHAKAARFVNWAGNDSSRLELARRCRRIEPNDLIGMSELMERLHPVFDDGAL